MRPHAVVLILILLLVSACDKGPGPAPAPATVQAEAQKCADAFLAGDYKTFAKYNHPKVLKMLGGEEKLIQVIRRGNADMAKAAVIFHSYRADPPTQILSSGNEWFAVLPTTLKMRTPDGILTQPGYLLGVSSDQANTWQFVDGAGMTAETQKLIMPNPPPGLTLPAKSQATMGRE